MGKHPRPSYKDGVPLSNEDVQRRIEGILKDPRAAVIYMTAALCDFDGAVVEGGIPTPSGKDQPRLKSREGLVHLELAPAAKILRGIRKERKDIFLVGFKTTSGASEEQQMEAALGLLKETSCNLVFANDIHTRLNMVVTPEMARYYVGGRGDALQGLVQMVERRSGLTFTRTSVVEGDLIQLDDPRVPASFGKVVKYLIEEGAYQPFRNVTVGHFAWRANESTLWSSRRKQNYNMSGGTDLVEVRFGPGGPVALGAKPSAGTRSQWRVLQDHPQFDCIVHAHVPLKAGASINVRPQHDFECGSEECGTNTSEGIVIQGNVGAVMLDKHGPNVIFHSSTDPAEVMAFLRANFVLKERTG